MIDYVSTRVLNDKYTGCKECAISNNYTYGPTGKWAIVLELVALLLHSYSCSIIIHVLLLLPSYSSIRRHLLLSMQLLLRGTCQISCIVKYVPINISILKVFIKVHVFLFMNSYCTISDDSPSR